MRREYDFSRARRNPYARRLTRAVTIRVDEATVLYFKSLAQVLGVSYRTIMTLYLRDLAATRRKPS